jgi:hypothetical protein
MDKKRGRLMIKKGSILLVLFIFLILTSGCETLKRSFGGAAKGASEGAKTDWENMQKLDARMREVLW